MGARSPRRVRVPVALRRMRIHRTVIAAVIVTVALATAFTAALIMYSGQAADAAVRSALRGASGTSISLQGAAPLIPTAQATAEIHDGVSNALGGVTVTVYAAPELDLTLPATATTPREAGMLLTTPNLAAHAKLLAGSWPQAGATGGQVPVALDQAAAKILRAGPGSRINATTDNAADATVVVTGVFAPTDASDPYWGLDPLAGAGSQDSGGFTTLGPFYTDASYLSHGTFAAEQMEWVAAPDIPAIGASGLGTRATALSAVLSRFATSGDLGNPGPTTRLPELLTSLAPAVLVAQSLVDAELLELLIVAVAALFIVVRLLSEVRETEAALLWARGGTGAQLIRLRAMESLLLAAPAVVIAPLAASPLAAAISRLGGGQSAPWPHVAVPAAVWVGVAGCALAAIAVILAPAFGSAVSPMALRTRRGRQAALTALGRAGFDLALLAFAVFAGWQLLSSGSIVGTDQSGNADYDPVAIGAPALVLAAGASVALRLLPPAARLGERLTRRNRTLAVPLAFWQTGRRPLKLAGPVLLTMLAVATGVFSLSERASAERSAADQAAFSVGADADARVAPGTFTASDLAALAASPGVGEVSPLFRATFVPDGGDLQTTLLALDPASAARTVALRSDLSAVPLSTLMNDVSGGLDANANIPAVATEAFADALHLGVGDLTSVSLGSGGGDLTVRIVAVVNGFPTISSVGGGLVVSEATAKLAPNEVWLRDTSTRTPRGLPAGAVITFRTQLQRQLDSAPLTEESLRALLAVALATMLLALCGLIVSVLSTRAERSAEFALLDALGFSRRGRIGTLCLEQALLVGLGALAGVGIGVAFGKVLIPVATLTAAAAKPQPPVTVLTPWAQVLAGVAVLLAAPLATFALVGTRRQTAAVLREGADR